MRNRVLRGGYFLSTALIALSISGAFQPAKAQAVTTVATVPGKILDSDGSHIFYTPTVNPNAPTLFDIATNTNTVVCNSCAVTSGFVTPTGAILQTSSTVQLFNGSLTTLAPSSGSSLIVAGKYAAYGDKAVILDTTTATVVARGPFHMKPNRGGLTADGTLVVAETPSGACLCNVYFFEGTFWTQITFAHITSSPYGPHLGDSIIYSSPKTDGRSFLYLLSDNGYELIYNNPTEAIRKTLTKYYPYQSPQDDFQIVNGWVAYRDVDGILILRSPSGATSTIGAVDSLMTLGSDGSVTYTSGGILYERDIGGGTMTIGSGYSNAFQVGTRWYFFGGGQLSRLPDHITYLNASFNASTDTFSAADDTVLVGSADFASSRNIAMAGSTAAYTGPYIIEFSGVVTGPGSLTKLGSGMLILSGNDTYTGGTTISEGVLQIGNGGTTGSIADDVVDNATLAFNRSDTYTYAGTISGTGNVSQIGNGTTILTGSNTYTGGTTISGGTLQIGNGGTTGSIAGDIVDNASLRFNRSDTYTYAGTISGTGAVTQAGSGTLILNGTNSYTGGTTVSSGSLVVGDAAHPGALVSGNVAVSGGATLRGHGTITGSVANGGTVAPGGSIGTLTVGSYTQASGGKLEIEVSPTDASRLHVTGAASLAGTVAFDFDAGTYGTRSYTVLDSSGLSGTFATVTMSGTPSNEFYQLQYTPTAVNLVLEPKRNAQIYSDFHRNTFASAETLNDMAFAHVETQHCTESGAPQGRDREPVCPKVAAWVQPFGGAGGYQDDSGLDDYSTRWAGVMGGIDFHSELGFALSITTAYASNTLAISGGSARATTNTFFLSLDGGMPLFDGRLDVNGHWIQNNGHAWRAVDPDAGGSLTATSRPKNEMFGGAVQYGHTIFSEDLTASARLTYTGSNLSAFHESGAEPFALAIQSKTISSLYGDLRLRYGHVYETESGMVLVPDVSGGVRAVLGGTARDVDGSLLGTVYNVANVPGGTQDRFAFVASAGVKARQSGAFSIYTRADTRISAHEQEGEITAGATIDF